MEEGTTLDIHPIEQLKITLREAWRCRKWLSLIFLATSILVLIVGALMPKTYTSSATLKLESNSIMRPLLKDKAVVTSTKDWVRNAKEMIFIESVLLNVIQKVDWGEEVDLNDEQVVKRLIKKIRTHAGVKGVGRSFIKFQYNSKNKKEAFEVAQYLTEAFILMTNEESRTKSKEAFDFISQQVDSYHVKLKASENRLKDFNDENFGGSLRAVSTRLTSLERELELANLSLSEMKFRKKSLKAQLSGEVRVSNTSGKSKIYRERIDALQTVLDQLRLTYHDSYPDIVSTKVQINELEKKIDETQNGDFIYSENISERERNANGVTLYQEIRSELSKIDADINAQIIRIKKLGELLAAQKVKVTHLNSNEAQLAELSRDYEVNNNIYQDLLMRRENSRVSMNVELEQKGALFKIVNPASVPVKPAGIDLLYFVLAAPFVGLLVPIALVYGYVTLDQKIRYSNAVYGFVDAPILATIPHFINRAEKLKSSQDNRFLFLVFGFFLAVYIAFFILNYIGKI